MTPDQSSRRCQWWWFLAVPCGLMLACLAVLATLFWPGGDLRALCSSVAVVANTQPRWRFHVNTGWLTLSAVRLGARFVEMPHEARVGLESVRGVEVGVYELDVAAGTHRGRILSAGDSAMESRGWERLAGVVQEHQVIAVYVPSKPAKSTAFKACIMVVDDRTLVVARVRGDFAAMAAFASEQLAAVTVEGGRDHPHPLTRLAANRNK